MYYLAGALLFGTAAAAGSYAAYKSYYPTTPEPTLQDYLAELINATKNEALIKKRDTLINDLITSGDDQLKKQTAWQAIIEKLNPEYYVTRDNTTKFYEVQPHINALVAAVSAALKDLDGKLANNPALATHATQFIFKASNYFSLASTLDPQNFERCTEWLVRARAFIDANGLKDTSVDAVWHNLMGGHKSRQYQMGLSVERPIEAVTLFETALRIHIEKLKTDLDKPSDIDRRHVQMCLISTILQDAMWCVVNDGKISEETQQSINRAKDLLDALTEARLVLKDGTTPDLYRLAGCLQSQAYVLILEGKFQEAVTKMLKAVNTMRDSIANTNATGQLSAILNDAACTWIAFAASLSELESVKACILKAEICLNESIDLSEGQFEQMYADNARKLLSQIKSDYKHCFYYKVADAVMSPKTLRNAPKKRAQ